MELMRKTDLKRYREIRRKSGYSENKDKRTKTILETFHVET
jgi:hypothetical protein